MRLQLVGQFCVAMAVFFAANWVIAEEKSGTVTAGTSSEELHKKRQVLNVQVSRLSADSPAEEADQSNPARETLGLLRSLDALYSQHQTRLAQKQELEIQAKEAEKKLESQDKFEPDEPKPYSFLLLENLKDQLALEEDREDPIAADLKSAKQLLQAAHKELDERESDRQKSSDKAVTKATDDDAADLRPEKLQVAIARAAVGLRQTEIEVHTLRLTLCKNKQKQLSKQVEIVKKDFAFTAHDRDDQLARLAGVEADFKRQRREVESGFQKIEAEQKAAIDQLTERKAQQSDIDATVQAWRAAGNAYQNAIVLLDQQIENITHVRRFWKRRYELANSAVEPKKLSQWKDDLDEFVDQLHDVSGSIKHRRDTARDEQPSIERQPKGGELEPLVEAAHSQAARLLELRDMCETILADTKSTERTLGRFQKELSAKLKATSGGWGTGIGDTLKSLVGYEILDVEDQSITIGKVLFLIAYVVGGVLLAYLLARVLGRHVLPRFGMHHGAASALKSIVFYTLCLVFGVLAFRVLQIPLAAFAFLGGAVAIAIGFGSQDIMNNFMSGIILLTEQPIRIGDVVQLEDVQGVVLHIGLRSTRLQTDANHELIVPNKTLIDEQVTNLTLTDNFVQVFVTVILDRSVPVVPAKWQMLEVAFSHPLVMKSPRPVVLLKEFDTYWSTFEVHFWLQHTSFMKCAIVQSEILEVISGLFPVETEPETLTSTSVPTDAAAGKSQPVADVKKLGNAAIAKALRRAGNSMKIKA